MPGFKIEESVPVQDYKISEDPVRSSQEDQCGEMQENGVSTSPYGEY